MNNERENKPIHFIGVRRMYVNVYHFLGRGIPIVFQKCTPELKFYRTKMNSYTTLNYLSKYNRYTISI